MEEGIGRVEHVVGEEGIDGDGRCGGDWARPVEESCKRCDMQGVETHLRKRSITRVQFF